MRISSLVAEDADRYRSLMLQAYAIDPDAFTSTPEERAAKPFSWWVDRIGGPNADSVTLGAFLDDELVGAVALAFSRKPKTRHRAHVLGMFVRRSHRGSGAGKALLEAATAHALARGTTTLFLTVTEGNGPALALYEALGFERIGLEPMAVLTPNGYKAKVSMWKRLDGGHTAPHEPRRS